MPQTRMRDSGGILRTLTRCRMRDEGGTLRTIQRIRMRDEGGTLRTVWVYLSVALDIYSEWQNDSGLAPAGYVTSDPITGTVTGGTPAYTYLWERVSGSLSISADTPTAIDTTFTAYVAAGSPAIGSWRLKVTDSTGAVAYSSPVELELVWVDTT